MNFQFIWPLGKNSTDPSEAIHAIKMIDYLLKCYQCPIGTARGEWKVNHVCNSTLDVSAVYSADSALSFCTMVLSMLVNASAEYNNVLNCHHGGITRMQKHVVELSNIS